MLSFDEAINRLLIQSDNFKDPEITSYPIDQAHGKVLAESIFSKASVPPFDNAAMDGIAFKLSDLSDKQVLPLSSTVFAGQSPSPLPKGTAVRIFTGAMIPEGADTVEMQENCLFQDNNVTIKHTPKQGQHIRKSAEDIAKNDLILNKGLKLKASHIGLLASTGVDRIKAFKPLCIGLISNGDELVSPSQTLKPGQIYNSNQLMIRALLLQHGFIVKTFHTADDLKAIKNTLEQCMQETQFVITMGGVSVGDADWMKKAIEELGHIDFWKVAMKPGKPLTFGHLADTNNRLPIIGLPGNPVSAFTSFQLFALPFLNKRQGMQAEDNRYEKYPILLEQPITPKREEFLRVKIIQDKGIHFLKPFTQQGSGILSSVAYSTGFARLPKNKTTQNNDEVNYIPFQ